MLPEALFMVGIGGFRGLSYRILIATGEAGHGVEFLQDVCAALVDTFGCSRVELRIREHGRSARWELTATPRRFRRLEEALASPGDPPHHAGGCEVVPTVSSLCCPLVLGDEEIGEALLESWSAEPLARLDQELLRDIGHVLAVAIAYHRVQAAQLERVKELTCLYEIARLSADRSLALREVLERAVAVLPPSWQYPEIAAARIALDGAVFETPRFESTVARQRASIPLGEEHVGIVEVGYREERPALDEGPFLQEERHLIDTVARELAGVITRLRAEEEQRVMQEQLRRADRLATIGNLAAGVAHELNEPLGAILGFAQLAAKHPALPETAARDLEKIQAASLHAREVVRKLMLLGRHTPPRRERVDLNEVVNDGLCLLGARCARQGVELVCELAPGLSALLAERAQIQQVLINLAVNAIQAMPEGGVLRVSTGRQGDGLFLEVQDSGVGMAPEVQARVFEPFFTTKQVGEGTGLGLPVVQGIVAAHRGRIELESRPGGGTRFQVHLPLTPEEQRP
ncbi:MAG: ATP-binding protein [Pseudomonadota bacterium]